VSGYAEHCVSLQPECPLYGFFVTVRNETVLTEMYEMLLKIYRTDSTFSLVSTWALCPGSKRPGRDANDLWSSSSDY